MEDLLPDLRRREAHRRQEEAPRVSVGHALRCREAHQLPKPHQRAGASSQERGVVIKSVPGELARPGECLAGLRASYKGVPGGPPPWNGRHRGSGTSAHQWQCRASPSQGEAVCVQVRGLSLPLPLLPGHSAPPARSFLVPHRSPVRSQTQLLPITHCSPLSFPVTVSGIEMRCPSSKS